MTSSRGLNADILGLLLIQFYGKPDFIIEAKEV